MSSPNIVWFCADQLRWDAISGYGNPHIHTPSIDRLMATGTTFDRAYCQNPLCTPSRASFLTGRYPRSTRVSYNGNLTFSKDETTVTKLLADSGYVCGLAGKLHLTACSKRKEEGAPYGYSFFQWSHHPFDSWPEGGNAYQDWLRAEGVDWYTEYGSTFHDWRPPVLPIPLPDNIHGIRPEYHQTTWCVSEAIRFIRQSEGKPWCVSVNLFDPHPPFDPPDVYKEKLDAAQMPLPLWKEGELDNKPCAQRDSYERTNANGIIPPTAALSSDEKREVTRDYYAEVLLLDDQLGRLLDYLEETGQRENTIVVFTSDHGEMLGDHGIYWKGGFFYEGLVHVPLVFSCPGLIREGVRSNALVELVDIAPTLLELTGRPIPQAVQGRSLAGLLTGGSALDHHKDGVYAEYYYSAAGLVPVCATMYFDGRYKVVVHHNGPVSELYDLEADPSEFDNLWDRPEARMLREEMVLKCFNHAVACNIDTVLGNSGTF